MALPEYMLTTMHGRLLSNHKGIIASLAVWVCLLICYSLTLSYDFYARQFDYIVYVVQLGFDIVIFVSAYFAYKNRSLECDSIFYLLLFLSILPGLFAN